MSKIFTRRNAIIAGITSSAVIASAPSALAEGGASEATASDGETVINTKPLSLEKITEPEIEGLSVPVNVPKDNDEVVLQGLSGRETEVYATMVACSWQGEDPDSIEVRSLSVDGKWSDWFRLDPIGDNESHATEAAWIGESTKVEIRASLYGEDVSEEVVAHLIETSEDSSDNDGANLRTFSLMASSAVSTNTYQPGYRAPTVISRKGWGANESYSGNTYTRDQTKGVFLHHTAGSNSYTRSQSAQQIRGMYHYHTRTLGWADLGYNVVVDKYGQIFEGRKGGLARNITGAHSLGFNRESFGVSVMGNYSTRSLPSAAIEAVSKIIAWKLSGTFQFNASAKTSFYNTTSGTRYPVNSTARLNVISAHRDVNYTDCPGGSYYRQLPSIRSRVQTLLNGSYKGHYNAYVKSGGLSKLGTVTEIAQQAGNYQTTKLTKGLVISTSSGSSAKAYMSSFADEWQSTWGRPLVSTTSSVQAFEKGTARRVNGKVSFSSGGKYFKDVPEGRAFENEINFLASKDIVRGWSDGTYRPSNTVLRDAVIVFIYRAMGSPAFTPPKVSPFSDVKTNNVFYKEISWAYSTGISIGWKMRNGTRQFRPFEPVKRDAMAAFLMRASGDKKPIFKGKSFKDVSSKTVFAAEIQWMKDNGISTGYADGTYRPLVNTKRDQMAAFIYRWMEHTNRI